MIKKVIGIIIIVFLQLNIVFAQNSFELEAMYSLTSEKLVNSSVILNERMNSHSYHSFGINSKKIFKSNVFIQGGLHLKNFGASEIIHAPIAIVDDTPNEINGRSIDIPIDVGYYFFNHHKVRLGISFGVNNGFLLNQYQNYYGVIKEEIPIYKNYLVQFNSSVEMGIKLTNYIILNIRPVWQRQINSNHGNYKQSGIGCQVGISYDFTEK